MKVRKRLIIGHRLSKGPKKTMPQIGGTVRVSS